MNKNRILSGPAFVFLLAVAPGAAGDGVCNAGIRDVTAAERAQVASVLKAAQSALPPAPEGWIIVVDRATEISVPSSICGDVDKLPWYYDLNRSYRKVDDAEARGKIVMGDAARMRDAMQAAQPRLQALQAKMQKIGEQQMALNQKQDYTGAERLQPQLAAAQKEYEKILEEAVNPAASVAADKEFNKGLQTTISVRVNPRSEPVGADAQAIALPGGAKSAQRWHVENERESEDRALYLFGAWKPDPKGKWSAGARAGASPAAAHAIAVLVTGDPEHVTKTVAAMDLAKLAAVVK